MELHLRSRILRTCYWYDCNNVVTRCLARKLLNTLNGTGSKLGVDTLFVFVWEQAVDAWRQDQTQGLKRLFWVAIHATSKEGPR